MMRKLFKKKQGQISTEIMYAVGVMIMIFLLLTGVTFNRKSELRRMDDYLQKRNECLRIANTISSLTASGFNTEATIFVYYGGRVFNNSRIVVGYDPASEKETPCTYVGIISPDNLQGGFTDLSAGTPYHFVNINEQVKIYRAS